MPTPLTRALLPWLLLAAFASALFSFGIGSYPLTDRDEALYSEVARECLDTGDWLTLHWQGKPWFIHAPLAMWVQATGFEVLGVSERTARLPSVLFGVGLVLLTAALGSRLFGRRVGFAAALILATSPLFFIIARMAILDMTFAFFVALSIYLFLRAWDDENPRFYPAFWLATGLATMAKGLWGLVLPAMVCFLYAISDSRRRRLLDWRLHASAVMWAAVVSPWLIVGTIRHGRDFLDPVLVTNTYARLTTSVCEHRGAWWFYLPILAVGLFPWIVLWPTALFRGHGRKGRLLLTWILPALILYSSARTKLPNYLLPLTPAFAIALASGVIGAKRRYAQAAAMPVIGGAIAFGVAAGLRSYDVFPGAGAPVGVLFFIVAAYAVAGLGFASRKDAGMVLSAICLASVLLLIPLGYMNVAHELSPKWIALAARSLAGDGPVMVIYKVSCEDGIYFYSREPFAESPNLAALVDEAKRQRAGYALVLTDPQFREVEKRGLKLQVFTRNRKWIVAKATGP